MTPDERQLITGLFDRMKPVAGQQRDRDAETLISEQVKTQPYAPYLLAQTVLVQDQALRAANDRILALEDEARKTQPASGQPQDTSFLGGLGRMFGGGAAAGASASVPTTGGHGPAPLPQEPGPYRGQGYGQQQGFNQQQGGPWGNQGAPQQQGGGMFGGGMGGGGGGGFMKGALGAAAGVAGGVLLADGIKGLFTGGHNPYGMASGFGGAEGAAGMGGGETVINNYYDGPQGDQQQDWGNQGGDPGGYASDPGGYSGGGDSGGYSQDV